VAVGDALASATGDALASATGIGLRVCPPLDRIPNPISAAAATATAIPDTNERRLATGSGATSNPTVGAYLGEQPADEGRLTLGGLRPYP
jgi:hypothetical protein